VSGVSARPGAPVNQSPIVRSPAAIMARRYDDLFGELEEAFPRRGERLVELPQALETIADHLSPAGAELVPVDEHLLGRTLAEPVTLTGSATRRSDEHQVAATLEAGTVLDPLHLGVLAQAGCEEVPTRRLVRVSVLSAAAGADASADGALLQLRSELARWRVEVNNLGVVPTEDEALLKAVAEGVTSDVLCIACAGSPHASVRESARKLGSRTLVHGLLCSPGSRTVAMKRQDCLLLILPAESGSAFLMHRLVLGFSLATLFGLAPAPPRELPVDCDLPMSDRLALLIPADHVRSRRGPAVRPLGNPEAPTATDLMQATCIVYLPPHSLPCQRGDRVRVLPVTAHRPGPPMGPGDDEERPR